MAGGEFEQVACTCTALDKIGSVDPDRVMQASQMWRQVGTDAQSVANELGIAIDALVSDTGWRGPGADAFKTTVQQMIDCANDMSARASGASPVHTGQEGGPAYYDGSTNIADELAELGEYCEPRRRSTLSNEPWAGGFSWHYADGDGKPFNFHFEPLEGGSIDFHIHEEDAVFDHVKATLGEGDVTLSHEQADTFFTWLLENRYSEAGAGGTCAEGDAYGYHNWVPGREELETARQTGTEIETKFADTKLTPPSVPPAFRQASSPTDPFGGAGGGGTGGLPGGGGGGTGGLPGGGGGGFGGGDIPGGGDFPGGGDYPGGGGDYPGGGGDYPGGGGDYPGGGGDPLDPPGGDPSDPPGGDPWEPGGDPLDPPGGGDDPWEPGGGITDPPGGGGDPWEPGDGGDPWEPGGGDPTDPPGGGITDPPGGGGDPWEPGDGGDPWVPGGGGGGPGITDPPEWDDEWQDSGTATAGVGGGGAGYTPGGLGGAGGATPAGLGGPMGGGMGGGGMGGGFGGPSGISGAVPGLNGATPGGAGGMGMMPMGGAPGGDDKDRDRSTWLHEDEDVWGAGTTAPPPVIGEK